LVRKKPSLIMSDWSEVAELLYAFEEQNDIRITIELSSCLTGDTNDLCVIGKAWSPTQDRRARPALASQSVRCLGERAASLKALIFYLLYQIDFQLGEREWEKTKASEADPGAPKG